ncbi:sugar ABC transporter ATP-binding protein [Falsochrobactrum sp. TDYN1]|uniref:Sugar ABC transporter ATP-binding protein n=1 Tax=Falsochrobactrum tianjinense TaxID=2706015 RepID=A0A949PMQ6_9HYPH|nr:sugar ABC transporter ATP-binding protein [Falsochrobactrum sp. TDYN1]MBV2143492.1 sugar ABC transporter ATP-binding protein [Falsochrobactrum sp. TDYN1]
MLYIKGLTKKFRNIVALDDMEFHLKPGEIHALLGENGAGKSTLINLIVGTFEPSAGELILNGQSHARMNPSLARAQGIASVFQEFSLVPDLTVLENLFLAREMTAKLFLKKSAMRAQAQALLDSLDFHVPLDALVGQLSRAQKQMVEIAKALRLEPKVLILDEPTASLTDGEAEKLFRAIRRLKERGVGIIYVSHRMAELRNLSDRVTVLRGGKYIGTVTTNEISDEGLIEMMIGRPVSELFPKISVQPTEVVLKVENLSTDNGTVSGASIYARAGEVVGLAGLVGCGRSELCRAVFGLEKMAEGKVTLNGKTISRPAPSQMLDNQLCYFPADRGEEGLALIRPARENVTMAGLDLPNVSFGPFFKHRKEPGIAAAALKELALSPLDTERRARSFSGGNQQKIMLARGLMKDFDVYIFDEPTVGIDVGAKADVYRYIKRLVEGGASVIVSTSELPELINLSTRIYVMHAGEIVAEIQEDEKTEANVLSHYFGKSASEESRA